MAEASATGSGCDRTISGLGTDLERTKWAAGDLACKDPSCCDVMSQVRYFWVGIVSILAVILAVLVRYIAAQGLRKQGSMSRR